MLRLSQQALSVSVAFLDHLATCHSWCLDIWQFATPCRQPELSLTSWLSSNPWEALQSTHATHSFCTQRSCIGPWQRLSTWKALHVSAPPLCPLHQKSMHPRIQAWPRDRLAPDTQQICLALRTLQQCCYTADLKWTGCCNKTAAMQAAPDWESSRSDNATMLKPDSSCDPGLLLSSSNDSIEVHPGMQPLMHPAGRV